MHPKTQSKINRQEAISRGEVTYTSTTPCKKCGSYEKYVSSYGCVPCMIQRGLEKLNDSKLMAPYRTKEKKGRWLRENREAVKEIKKRYRDTNRRSLRVKGREYYYDNVDRFRNNTLKSKYNLTLEQYNEILEKQRGMCAICETDKCKSGRYFTVDHSHKTSKVRGLLCGNCNSGLGMFSDNIDFLKRAISYLEKYS